MEQGGYLRTEEEQSKTGGLVRGKREVTETTAAADRDSRSGRQIEDPTEGTQEYSAGRTYCMGGTDTKEKAADSAEWRGEEIEELASEEESETA